MKPRTKWGEAKSLIAEAKPGQIVFTTAIRGSIYSAAKYAGCKIRLNRVLQAGTNALLGYNVLIIK